MFGVFRVIRPLNDDKCKQQEERKRKKEALFTYTIELSIEYKFYMY
jgi:hypothetical protein